MLCPVSYQPSISHFTTQCPFTYATPSCRKCSPPLCSTHYSYLLPGSLKVCFIIFTAPTNTSLPYPSSSASERNPPHPPPTQRVTIHAAPTSSMHRPNSTTSGFHQGRASALTHGSLLESLQFAASKALYLLSHPNFPQDQHWANQHGLHSLSRLDSHFLTFAKAHEEEIYPGIPKFGRGKGGLAIFLRKALFIDSKDLKSTTPRVQAISTKHVSTSTNLLIINCYLPSGTSHDEVNEYHLCLSTILSFLSSVDTRNHIKIVAGDFNADPMQTSPRKCTADILKNFLASEDLCSLTSLSCSPSDYTFMSDDGSKKSRIDGFIIPPQEIRLYSQHKIIAEHPLNSSDHRPVLITAELPTSKSPAGLKCMPEATANHLTPIQRYSILWPSDRNEIASLYTNSLELEAATIFRNLHSLSLDLATVDLLFGRLQDQILELSLRLPHKAHKDKKQGKPVWTQDVKSAYSHSLAHWKKWKQAGKPVDGHPTWKSYLEAKKDFRRALRQSEASNRLKVQGKIELANDMNCSSLFYSLVKSNKEGKPSTVDLPFMVYRETLFQGKDVIKGWKSYFQDLSSDPTATNYEGAKHMNEHSPNLPSIQSEGAEEVLLTLTSHDLDTAIRKLKLHKAPGLDNITSEHLVHSGPIFRRLLLLLLQNSTKLAHLPASLKEAVIIPLHKGGSKPVSEPSSYRGISLSPTLSKLLEIALKPKIEDSLVEVNTPDELQFGFQASKSCILASLTLEMLIELNTSRKKLTYLALLDVAKAFDCVWHPGLFQKLADTPIPLEAQSTLVEMYNGASSRVLWKGDASCSFPLHKGVRQGGILSPLLYNIFIDGLIKLLRDKDLGCHCQNLYAGVIVLADNVALIASSAKELQCMLNLIHTYATTWKYKINPSKSAILVFNGQDHLKHTWYLNEEEVQEVSQHPHSWCHQVFNISRSCAEHHCQGI
nr:uncharacterized protein LOC129274137 [Lytechinus pictus]